MPYGDKIIGVVDCLDKDYVSYYEEGVVAYFDKGFLACLDKNIRDDFYGDLIHEHPLEHLLEEILGGKSLVHHSFIH